MHHELKLKMPGTSIKEHQRDFQTITGKLARDNGALPARVVSHVPCSGICRSPTVTSWAKLSLLTRLEKALHDGVKALGGDGACRSLKLLLCVIVDGGIATFSIPTRNFGAGVAHVMVPSQMLLKFAPVTPLDLEGDAFNGVVLRMVRKPWVEHHQCIMLTPYALHGALDISVKAEFLADAIGPGDPLSAICTFLRSRWSEVDADELIIVGKVDRPYPWPQHSETTYSATRAF